MSDLVLIVGGPHDGKRVKYAGETMHLLVIGPMKAGPASEQNWLEVQSTATYVERTIVGQDRSAMSVYVPPDQTLGATIELLLKHYKPGGK